MTFLKNKTQRYDLYRHYNADGVLLYVGQSFSGLFRTGMHRNESFWFHDIETIKIQRFKNWFEVTEAETFAIKSEFPLYNKQHLDAKPCEHQQIKPPDFADNYWYKKYIKARDERDRYIRKSNKLEKIIYTEGGVEKYLKQRSKIMKAAFLRSAKNRKKRIAEKKDVNIKKANKSAKKSSKGNSG